MARGRPSLFPVGPRSFGLTGWTPPERWGRLPLPRPGLNLRKDSRLSLSISPRSQMERCRLSSVCHQTTGRQSARANDGGYGTHGVKSLMQEAPVRGFCTSCITAHPRHLTVNAGQVPNGRLRLNGNTRYCVQCTQAFNMRGSKSRELESQVESESPHFSGA